MDFRLFLYYNFSFFFSFLIGKDSDSDISDYAMNTSSSSSNESIVHENKKRKQKNQSCKYMINRCYVHQALLQSFFIIDSICIADRETYIKKKRWTDKEITDAKVYFSKYIRKGKLPPLPEIEKVKMTYNILKDRKPDVIKTWLHNQLKKNKTFE